MIIVSFEQCLKEVRESIDIGIKRVLGEGNSKYKDFEVAASLLYLR